MSNLKDVPEWAEGIYQLTVETPVLGKQEDVPGDGPSNIQAQQLANRTRWLRLQLESASDYREYTFFKTTSDPDGTRAGLAGTPEGKMFRVVQGPDDTLAFIYYLNDGGTAVKQSGLLGQGSITNTIRLYKTQQQAIDDLSAGNILPGSKCWIDSEDDFLSHEYTNVGGALESTGRVQPSKEYVDDVSGPVKFLDSKTNATFFHRWKDKVGTVIAGWKKSSNGSVFFDSRMLKFGPNGFFGQGMEISADKIGNNQVKAVKGADGVTRMIDKRGITFAKIKNGIVTLSKLKLDVLSNMSISSGNTIWNIKKSGSDITVSDKRGIIGFRLDARGYLHGNFINANKDDKQLTEEDILFRLEALAAAKQANRYNRIYNSEPRTRKKYKIILLYGQSFIPAAQSNCVLTPHSRYNSVMLGQSPRGMYFSNPPAGSEVYGPVGGENKFYPLGEVCQDTSGNIVSQSGYGETMCTSIADEFKRMHNQSIGVEDDPDTVICIGACGVAGRSIAQLSKGASPELYNRVETFLSGVAEAVAAEGAEWEVVAIIYGQGENDNSQSMTFYQQKSIEMRMNLIASCKAASGQKHDPGYFINQIGNTYINGMGVPLAQSKLPELVGRTVLVASYQGLPNPGAHLCANSYRALGCLYAREIWRYYDNNGDFTFRAVKACHRSNVAYVSFTPRVAPLSFKSSYNKWDETMYDDKGFTITDGSGSLSGSDLTVEIVSDRVVRLTAIREFTGAVTILLGDKTHAGIHNLCDSSVEEAGINWEYTGAVQGQYTQENIASLVNKPYSLTNYAAIGQISSEAI